MTSEFVQCSSGRRIQHRGGVDKVELRVEKPRASMRSQIQESLARDLPGLDTALRCAALRHRVLFGQRKHVRGETDSPTLSER